MAEKSKSRYYASTQKEDDYNLKQWNRCLGHRS